MEAVLMLSYYVQLREHMRSSISRPAKPDHHAHLEQDGRHLICGSEASRNLTEKTVPNTPPSLRYNATGMAQPDTTPAQPVDLNDAFEAMTEKINIDWPEFSPLDRITVGLIESTLGLLLFLALIAGAVFLQQGLIHHP
ncbi:MAG: hypothetical protein JO025_22105 [Verrucomicrobia bacterium]|nr:hypothetical protein [Verrucomicrobiota bacterium]